MCPTILGISAFYHDAAAALVCNGEILAAAQEERFSRKKHDPRFPRGAINYCLEEAFVDGDDLDAITFYDDPLLTFDRVVKNALMTAPSGAEQFRKAVGSVLGIKVWINDYVREAIGSVGKVGKVLFTEHHMAHAASAFYPSPFESAAILTIDGVGEWATTTLGRGHGNSVELVEEIDYPHSLGLLYSAFTYYCGFKVNSGEYKLMGLAPYGEPAYYRQIRDYLIDIREDGSYRLNLEYFGYLDGLVMTNERFHSLFGGPPRASESRITRRHMDLAASIQKITEEAVLKLARYICRTTGESRLVMAGGVALNCVANGKLVREGGLQGLWIQPAAGDAGGALGAALLTQHVYFEVPRETHGMDGQKGSYLGPSFRLAEVRAFLDRHNYPYKHVPEQNERLAIIARAIADGKVVGYFRGRMEFGPRALGARSILADPRNPDTQALVNLKVKYRESFRPFAPAVLQDRVSEYFDFCGESPYMLIVAPVREDRRRPMDTFEFERDEDMIGVINQPRSDLPAITHVDYSARLQTVGPAQQHPELTDLLKAFERLTGYPVVVNTSFNVRGEPIVCTPRDAYLCFMRTEMDLLVLEEMLLWKKDQPDFNDVEDWRKSYELD